MWWPWKPTIQMKIIYELIDAQFYTRISGPVGKH
jgi:hypothetical protein